jgi:hypothetical protein
LLGRIDAMLESKVHDILGAIIEASSKRLARDIQAGLHAGMEDLVARTVAQEISRMQKSKNKI